MNCTFVGAMALLRYNWERKDWPNFKYSLKGMDELLLKVNTLMAKYDGVVKTLPKGMKAETVIDLMVAEAIKTSEIEGEYYSRKDVLSSIKKNMGVQLKAFNLQDKNAESVSKLMLVVRETYAKPLSKKMLLEWHSILFEYDKNIPVGKWRTHKEPMQVVSGALGKQKIHFEAPPSARMNDEMRAFVKWFNNTAPNGKQSMVHNSVRAAVAHLYFLSIHPFEDGNGRIGRALAEKVLSQGNASPVMMSLSVAIEKKKKDYYANLQKAQSKNEITAWVQYFVKTVYEALKLAEVQIEFTLSKARFFERYRNELNARQLKVVRRMLDEGVVGFKGGMNTRKYMGITKTSKATATRDLQDLAAKKVFVAEGGGRSTSYTLVLN
jgi:Fic family protein